jgi:STAGA complex 65 subunit gamma
MKSNDNIFSKPLWFCKPSTGTPPPKNYAQLTKPVVLEVLKKALCGLLKVAGFTEIDESALIMFVDAIDEFYKSFMENARFMAVDREVQSPELDVTTLEKAYVNLSNKSLTTLHNYFKEILRTNRQEIAEFKEAEFEYEKLLHENNLAQNLTGLAKDNGEFISFLDTSAVAGNGNIMSFLDSDK